MGLLKAPSYKLVEENSKYENSYFFSLDQPSRKSLFYPMCNIENLGDSDQPFYGNVGELLQKRTFLGRNMSFFGLVKVFINQLEHSATG